VTLSSIAITEISAQECETAWLVLLTISHPDLPVPIRVTSDAVATTSSGNVYTAFPFDITLPEDIEGRAPQARLSIDNTSQEIIAALRGLITPPTISIYIVRADAPDIIERQWSGLEWRTSQYNLGIITGTLTVEDLSTEEFPYVTFDGRFKGLFV
jgi:hypothetical protein